MGHWTGSDRQASAGESRRRYEGRNRNPWRAAAWGPHRCSGTEVPARRYEGERSGQRARRPAAMNIGEMSVRHNRVAVAAVLLILAGGAIAYRNLGRLEDPEFTIKEALIVTTYPGASAEEVEKEV